VTSEAKDAVTSKFKAERDSALKEANKHITADLATQREELRKLLRRIDDMAEVELVSASPDNDGLVLTGKIRLSQRKQPRVEFTQLGDDSGYTAFDSWVPGGRITGFHWTWWRREDHVPGQLWIPLHEKTHDDRFLLQEGTLFGAAPQGASGQTAGSQAEFDASLNYALAPGPLTGIWIPPETRRP
jgi:hypothetical protein